MSATDTLNTDLATSVNLAISRFP